MAKVEIDIVRAVLQRNELEVRKVSEIIEELNKYLEEQKEEKPPAVKKQFAMLLSDPNGDLIGKDYTGWVLQIPEDDSPAVVEERLIKCAYEYNTTPKGRKMPVATIGEACEVINGRISKEHNVWVKTKEPVLIVRTDNEFPEMEDDGL